MTRDEFMNYAREEVDRAFQGQKNRMMNLVAQAWAEGKKNAEAAVIEERANDILEVIRKQISDAAEAYKVHVDSPMVEKTIPITTPDIHFEHMLDWSSISPLDNSIPSSCKTCSNHTSNGGSGICHCIMGITPMKC